MADVSPRAWRTGESGTYVNWQVWFGNSTNPVSIVGGAGPGASYYMYDSDTTAYGTLRSRSRKT